MDLFKMNRLLSILPRLKNGTISGYFEMKNAAKNKFAKPTTSFEPVELTCYKNLLAEDWWYGEGNVKWLHSLNDMRVPLIYNSFLNSHTLDSNLEPRKEFKNIHILDIGCGGGLCSEALAELNFNVTGIDPNPSMISIAKSHASANRLLCGKEPIKYFESTIEEFSIKNPGKFDAIVVSEVMDRVVHKDLFLTACMQALKIGGDVFITTRSRTTQTYLTILGSFLLKALPRKCISWNGGIRREHLEKRLQMCGCTVSGTRGLAYRPLVCRFRYVEYTDIWYFMHAVKRAHILS